MSVTFTTGDYSIQVASGDIATPDTPDDVSATVTDAEVTLGIDQESMTARVSFSSRPSVVDEGLFLYVYGGLGGASDTLFNGEVDGIDWATTSGVTVAGLDYLARVRQRWGGGEYEYVSQTDGAIVQNLVEKSGVPSSLTHIQDNGRLLGVGRRIKLRDGDVPLDMIRKIDESMPRWATCCHSNGAIYRFPIALGTPVASYTEGSSPCIAVTRKRTRQGIRNAIRVRPLMIDNVVNEATFQAANSYIPTPPGYYTENFENPYLESNTDRDTVGAALLTDLNKRPQSGTIQTLLDGTVQPGDTVNVTSTRCELSGQDVFVVGLTHRILAGITEIRYWIL